MQRKQVVQFLTLLLFILVMVGAYMGIRSYQARQEKEKNKQEAEALIPLTSFQPDSVTAISYDLDGTKYIFEKDGEKDRNFLP